MEVLSSGGYLYDDNSKIIGLWDGWEKANYPNWMFAIALPITLITEMPYWWMVAFWGIGIWLMICYLSPYILTERRVD